VKGAAMWSDKLSKGLIDAQEREITIRRSRPEDATALERLAQLDSRTLSGGDLLLAEVGDELHAAVPVGGGQPIADPFRPTAELIAVLSMRARQL
jgi:hypothetical protein